jgi:DnaJ-class molecular chaperone
MTTHYETLGISETATQEEIKKAYRSLASKHHPDKGGDTAKFQEIQAAYAVLEDENKRAQYDHERRNPHGGGFQFTGADIPPEMADLFRNFGFDFGGGGFRQRPQQQVRRNKDLRIVVPVALADTLEAHKRVVEFRTTNGEPQTVEIDVPRGVHMNSTIRYSKLGDNFFSTLPRGDLHIEFRIIGDRRFDVSGYDLIAGLDIDCLSAIIGTEQEFTTLDDKTFSITIPAGTQAGTKFKVPGQGLYSMNQNMRGNLYLIANITVPTNLSIEKMETIRNLITK